MPEIIVNLDLDGEVLNHLPLAESWVVFRGEGMQAALIEDEGVQEVYKWADNHLREHKVPPSKEALTDTFDIEFDEDPVTAPGDLIERLRLRYAETEGHKALKEIIDGYKAQPTSLAKLLDKHGKQLQQLLNRSGELFGTGDYDRAKDLYYKKTQQGKGASLGFEELDDYFAGQRGVTVILGPPKTWKALALDTRIPTSTGWATMQSLKVGDQIFDEHESPCRVIGKSPIWKDRPCYRVVFSDGTSIIADAEHEWITKTIKPESHENIWTTQQIADTLRAGDYHNHSISSRSKTRQIVAVEPIASVPVQCISVDSPSHLYLAGDGMVPTHNSWVMIKGTVANVENGFYPFLYSLELPAEETDMRLRCMVSEVPWHKYIHDNINKEEWERIHNASDILDSMGTYRIVKPPRGERDLNTLVGQAKDAGADVVFIDQLQYVEVNGQSLGAWNKTEKYFDVLNHARDLSDDIPITIAHQFNRSTMNAEQMPSVQQAKGSSAVEEAATLCLGLWASKEMRESRTCELGTLAARNHDFRSWEVGINLSSRCSFEIRGVIDDNA